MSKMKNKRRIIIVLIIGFIMGLSLSGLGTYAATTYAINAAKIGYSDNSNLGVDNVQAAIDGTCSRIDSRLNNLEQLSKRHELTYLDNSNYRLNGLNGTYSYWYKIGNLVIVNITLYVITPSTSSASLAGVIKDLPTPKYNMNYISLTSEQPTGSSAVGVLKTDGILYVMSGTAGHIMEGQFIYAAA